MFWFVIDKRQQLFVEDFPCRGENCKISFSTILVETNMKKLKNHGPQLEEKTKIPCVNNLYRCPTNRRDVESKHKHNTVKHLNMCVELKKKRNTVANNKACPVCSKVCSKVFAQKPNSKRQVKNFYQDSEYDIVIDNQHDKDTQNETKPSMVLAIDTVPP